MRRRIRLLVTFAPITLVAALPVQWTLATPAAAFTLPAACSQSDPTHVTCTYTSTGENDFDVPNGLDTLTVTAIGAPGGPSSYGGGAADTGGVGAIVSGTVSVTPGSTVYAEVGGAGSAGSGGANGGGGDDSAFGGGGGGGSDLRTIASANTGSLASRLIVAGGGGGAGGVSSATLSGGAAGQDGQSGTNGTDDSGKAGTQSAGGAAGAGDGDGDAGIPSAGSLGSGGTASFCAGGGGGGLYGGGGGNSDEPGECGTKNYAGGGGGGSSLVPDGGTSSLAADTTVTPEVVIGYVDNVTTAVGGSSTEPSYPTAPTFTVTGLPASASGTVSFVDDATTQVLCTADAPSGTCTPADPLSAGDHTIDVSYGGDAIHAGSSSSFTATVDQGIPTLQVISATDPSTYGEEPALSANVTPSTVTGSVQFSVDGTDLGSPATVSGGTATGPDLVDSSAQPLTAGDHTVEATLVSTDSNYAGATQDLTQTVDQAGSSTALAVGPTQLSATVSAEAPASGNPTGMVTFSVDGSSVGMASLSNGVATLAYTVPAGATHQVAASYPGDTNFVGSSDSTARQDPTITARVSSAEPISPAGWYRTPITVSFTCTPTSAALTTPCPAPVVLSSNVKSKTITHTILASDGGAATVNVGPLNLDQTKPTVRITDVKAGALYGTPGPKAGCSAHDSLSGLDGSCTVTTTKLGNGQRMVTATATDLAGNVATATLRYSVAAFFVRNVARSHGAFVVHRGHQYVVEVDSSKRPTYYYAQPATSGRPTPYVVGPAMARAGKGRWTLPISITPLMSRYRYWNIGARFRGSLHVIRLDVRS